jgi:ubiquinone/menaquinone biosynthesis C-methylase UbiE
MFKNQSFDIVVSDRYLHTVSNKYSVVKYILSEMLRVLKPNGLLILSYEDINSISSSCMTVPEELLLKN